jgi:hypothetical protein
MPTNPQKHAEKRRRLILFSQQIRKKKRKSGPAQLSAGPVS